jgi:hypothetical protein
MLDYKKDYKTKPDNNSQAYFIPDYLKTYNGKTI